METFIVYPENKAQANAIKAILKALNVSFQKTTEHRTYDEDFVKKIKKMHVKKIKLLCFMFGCCVS
ncbi:DUF2683 family protein [Olivibacter ginsenosidimutans]